VTTQPASCIDEQILAIWRALRVNPSLDARWAMQVIDRLLLTFINLVRTGLAI